MATTSTRRIEYLPVADLVDDPRNPKVHADDVLDASLERFGYTAPIEIDERTGRLISGHGRKAMLLRAEAAGEPVPDGIEVGPDGRWQAPVVRGWASRDDDEALAYLVASNRTVEAGGWVVPELAGILASLYEGPGLSGTGYIPIDLEALLAEVRPQFDPEDPDGQPRLDVRNPTICPNCGHSWHKS
jgi:hypothetical protein